MVRVGLLMTKAEKVKGCLTNMDIPDAKRKEIE
jgi:hypothetical protein